MPDVRFVLFMMLWVTIVVVCGALGYTVTGSMKFVAGQLNYITIPFAILIAAVVATALPCSEACPLTRVA